MGYDLHITRKEYWADEGQDIATEDWLALIEHDPELSLWPENGPYFAVWSGSSLHKNPWLDWSDGKIFSKNPDLELTTKMVEIADKLGAAVQGDEGEIYDSDYLASESTKKVFADIAAYWVNPSQETSANNNQKPSKLRIINPKRSLIFVIANAVLMIFLCTRGLDSGLSTMFIGIFIGGVFLAGVYPFRIDTENDKMTRQGDLQFLLFLIPYTILTIGLSSLGCAVVAKFGLALCGERVLDSCLLSVGFGSVIACILWLIFRVSSRFIPFPARK